MHHISMFSGRGNDWRARVGQRGYIAGIALAASALSACGSPADELAIGSAQQKILGGVVDDDHSEVMLLVNRAGFLCTGTVIRAERQRAFLLTAAHCLTEEAARGGVTPIAADQFVVVPGVDFAESTSAFPVDAVSVEPNYDGSFAGNDIGIVRFFFGNAAAPKAIPPLAAADDKLAVNDGLLLVGYGQTEVDEDNTQRRRVERSVEALDAELVAYSQEDGDGACFGDSGGPGLIEVGGGERVAVVISGGVSDEDEGCAGGLGVATRVSGYESFIQDVLAGNGPD
jgi:trypsin